MNKTAKIQVWYLNHSGFAVKTKSHFLIFDYFPGEGKPFWGGIEEGLLHPKDLKGEKVVVFSSHAHYDHFSKEIFELRDEVSNIQYILSDDIKNLSQYDKGDILSIHFWKEYNLDNMHITTLHSTDAGVAFFVEVDGISLYFAGDLNWWHWNGEEEHFNKTMGGEYRHEIDSLLGKKIDIAFVPLDPRLEEHYLLGIDYFMKTLSPSTLFPMHFWDRYEVFTWLKEDARAKDYIKQIKEITHRGQLFELEMQETL